MIIPRRNLHVIDYVQLNKDFNSRAFDGTQMKSMTLNEYQEDLLDLLNFFEVMVISGCIFFNEFHKNLVRVVTYLLKNTRLLCV